MKIRTYTILLCSLTLTFLLLLAGCASEPEAAANDPNEEEWIQLFNGKDLTDWHVKLAGHELDDNYKNTFRVENGMLKVSYDDAVTFDNRFGLIFYKEPFSHYRVAVEYRFIGEQAPDGPGWAFRNSGVMVHCLDPESMTKDQDFPISIEVQLLGGNGTDERPTANLCTPGTNVVMNGELVETHCISSTSKTYHGDQWVRVEAEVLGDESIKHIVEGETVLEYSKPQIGGGNVSKYDESVKVDGQPLTAGWIALQAESHPLEFRKVELLNLKGCMDPKASNFKSYYVAPDEAACQY
jgi:hypothetical protein